VEFAARERSHVVEGTMFLSQHHATVLPSLERHAERFEKGSLLNLVPIVSDPHHLVATNAADNL
jgi:hypothetical protein